MNQQKIYQTCISYGACVEGYIQDSILHNGDKDDAFYCEVLLLQKELIDMGVDIDTDKERLEIINRIKDELKTRK